MACYRGRTAYVMVAVMMRKLKEKTTWLGLMMLWFAFYGQELTTEQKEALLYIVEIIFGTGLVVYKEE